ncbi:hypothetical protein N7468_006060 [Penicillium chermesinum]|uniref:Isochorismatase-like domain-containing protein n=1 Tax=Penicillium chermesinum TaxID=63820 RepID=A0A9W9P065_9EURO|nr:uncharacterized protein N7468_006060 [Penicillium chermesinum]KAJ5233104.1 hypothetical protein N7468_006060 [Penicillium chermesinum]KAJ6172737.1 hypothetical protein N7470_001804 [Penicillium chermesinum]
MSKTALFVIDTQAELVSNAGTAIPHAARICHACAAILERARSAPASSVEIIVVQHAEDPSDPEATLIPGNTGWELTLPPQGNVVNERLVQKTTADTFESNHTLASDLKAQGISKIVACGVQSDFCVRATCRGAVDAGFDVVLLQGAHSTYDSSDKGKTAEEIERDIEEELERTGVHITHWEDYAF